MQVLTWLNQNSGTGQLVAAVLQAFAAIVLVFVTGRYVALTKKLADSAEAQHNETLRAHEKQQTPNLLLVEPQDAPNFVGNWDSEPSSIRGGDRKAFHLLNLGSGTIWIDRWRVDVKAEARSWTSDSAGPRNPLFRPGDVRPIYEVPRFLPRTFHGEGAKDEVGNPIFDEPGVQEVKLRIEYYYSETGSILHVSEFVVSKIATGVHVQRENKIPIGG